MEKWNKTIMKEQIAKPSKDDLICYCFGYTVADIEQDFIKNGRSLIAEKIAGEKKTGGCDCANKNPRGR